MERATAKVVHFLVGMPYSENTRAGMRAQGLCFAIGIDIDKSVAGRLIKDGKIERVYIGVVSQNTPLPRRLVAFHGLELRSAVLVVGVESGSPAECAGLRERHILVSINCVAIDGVDTLQRVLSGHESGDSPKASWGAEKLRITIVPISCSRR